MKWRDKQKLIKMNKYMKMKKLYIFVLRTKVNNFIYVIYSFQNEINIIRNF